MQGLSLLQVAQFEPLRLAHEYVDRFTEARKLSFGVELRPEWEVRGA
jgi:hypothetical protein